jgi:hypothetical protein
MLTPYKQRRAPASMAPYNPRGIPGLRVQARTLVMVVPCSAPRAPPSWRPYLDPDLKNIFSRVYLWKKNYRKVKIKKLHICQLVCGRPRLEEWPCRLPCNVYFLSSCSTYMQLREVEGDWARLKPCKLLFGWLYLLSLYEKRWCLVVCVNKCCIRWIIIKMLFILHNYSLIFFIYLITSWSSLKYFNIYHLIFTNHHTKDIINHTNHGTNDL